MFGLAVPHISNAFCHDGARLCRTVQLLPISTSGGRGGATLIQLNFWFA